MERADYPSLNVTTPYGALVLTFLDPSADRLHAEFTGDFSRYRGDYDDKNKPQYHIRGELTINGVALNISMYLRIGELYKNCEPTGQKGLVSAGGDYNRRVDLRGWDWNAGYAKKLHNEIPKLLEPITREHAHLEIEARRTTLFNIALQARDNIERAEKDLAIANEKGKRALEASLAFNKENP